MTVSRGFRCLAKEDNQWDCWVETWKIARHRKKETSAAASRQEGNDHGRIGDNRTLNVTLTIFQNEWMDDQTVSFKSHKLFWDR
jgi:hypothetical protein